MMLELVPRRPFGSALGDSNLPKDVPIIGLGCSSFSTFFWTEDELSSDNDKGSTITAEKLSKDHPKVQEWIKTIHYAVKDCGITLLDTAPWYGHGTSEVAIGFAMETGLKDMRSEMTINTKLGRYEADPSRMFDFSKETTLRSIQRSIQRMQCDYIDCLQLHDPEFAPSLDQLFEETIPAMIEAKKKGWCRTLGMTGYPLQVQHQILQGSLERFGPGVWDQALTYGHFNLHDQSLTQLVIGGDATLADYCDKHGIGLLAAAPLSMGLLVHGAPPSWHPASTELKEACTRAADICHQHSVNIAALATVFALSQPRLPCTIIGCKNIDEVERAAAAARRFADNNKSGSSQDEILTATLTTNEKAALDILQDKEKGPFAHVWKSGGYFWDGVAEAQTFWAGVEGASYQKWQKGLLN